MKRAIKRQAISGTQIKLIHTLASALKMPDRDYRAMLYERYRVESSKELDTLQAAELIRDLEAKAIAADVWKRKNDRQGNSNARSAKPKSAASTYDDLSQRQGNMATPAQLRKIETMWEDVSRIEEPEARKEGLRHFIKRQAKVSHIRFLDMRGASAVICALESMQKQQRDGATKAKRKNAA